MDKVNEDFDSLKPTNVKDIGVGRTGILPDGATVIVRSRSSGGVPTLEIQSKTKSIKFRY